MYVMMVSFSHTIVHSLSTGFLKEDVLQRTWVTKLVFSKCQVYSLAEIASRTSLVLIKVANNIILFFLALKTQEKDGTSSSLKYPRQSTKEVSVTEFSFVFCKHKTKLTPQWMKNYQGLGIATISVTVGAKKPFMPQICCASTLFEPCLWE